jgi:hypothetical protein
MTNNVKQEFKSFPSDIVTHCLTDDCSECTGSYINELLGYRLLCECACHKNKSEEITIEPVYFRNRISMAKLIVGGNLGS